MTRGNEFFLGEDWGIPSETPALFERVWGGFSVKPPAVS